MKYLTCTTCHKKKKVSKFPKDKRKSNGLSSMCYLCHNQSVKKFRAKNPDYAKEKQRVYRERNL